MNKPVAVTYTQNKWDKKFTEIKLCYITKHPDITESFWNTKIVQKLFTNTFCIDDIVDHYCSKHRIIFLPDVIKGNRITEVEAMILRDKIGVLI